MWRNKNRYDSFPKKDEDNFALSYICYIKPRAISYIGMHTANPAKTQSLTQLLTVKMKEFGLNHDDSLPKWEMYILPSFQSDIL